MYIEPRIAVASAEPNSGWPELPEAVCQLPISLLHIGQKSAWLVRAGYMTVGQLLEGGPAQLMRLPSVGPRTVRTITDRLNQLALCSEEGSLDLARYCKVCGLLLLPAADVTHGGEVLDALPDLLANLSMWLPDDVYRRVLSERLSRPPHEQRILEDIGAGCQPPITRERVRQKEKKLISQLTESLIWNADNDFDFHFRPSFSAFWRTAAAEFIGVDEIAFDEFVSRLGRVWKVDPAKLTAHLPIIIAIVTGEPQMPAAFRAGMRLDARLLNGLPEVTRQIPLKLLRLGKRCERLEARGLTVLGDLLAPQTVGRLGSAIVDHLDIIAKSLTPEGSMDWGRYAESLGLRCIPSESLGTAQQFATGFVSTVAEILHAIGTERRVQIFELRSSQPPRKRPTLDAVAKILGTHGPTVKREETELLQQLHDVLVDRDFTSLDLWLGHEWLSQVGEAAETFAASGRDYDRFKIALALRWRIGPQLLEGAVPALWAIFTGYPPSRRRQCTITKISLDQEPAVEPARIRLTGFRRLH